MPGNHDDAARKYLHLQLGGVKVVPHARHITADGRSLMVCHGDQYDLVVKHSRMLSVLGSTAYEWLLVLNRGYNWLRSCFGKPYFSLAASIKSRVKHACTFISKFEKTLADEARRRRMDGVVCGHIHKAEMTSGKEGVAYYNCGDWVESCTALVEDEQGRISILDGLAFIKQFDQNRADSPHTTANPGTSSARDQVLEQLSMHAEAVWLMTDQLNNASKEQPPAAIDQGADSKAEPVSA